MRSLKKSRWDFRMEPYGGQDRADWDGMAAGMY